MITPSDGELHRRACCRAVVEPAAQEGAGNGEDRQDDAEDAERHGAPAEGRRGIDAAEGDDGGEPVVVEHEGDQVEQRVAVMAELPHRVQQRRARPLSPPRAAAGAAAGAVRREQEHRDHEQRQPQRRGRAHQALEPCRSRDRGRTAAGRCAARPNIAGRLTDQHGEQRHQPAAIAQAPAEAAQPAHALGPHDVGQLRVVEHDRHLRADRRHHDRPADRRHELGTMRDRPTTA